MKKYSILFILIAAGSQFSCNNDLDPKVYSSFTNANGFQSKSDAVAAINSVYGRLKGPSVGDNFRLLGNKTFCIDRSCYRFRTLSIWW